MLFFVVFLPVRKPLVATFSETYAVILSKNNYKKEDQRKYEHFKSIRKT